MHALLVYVSSFHLLTLIYSMWFHDTFRADDWLLHEMESHRAYGQRALVFSKIFTKEGKLVISCAQEGLIRSTNKEAKM